MSLTVILITNLRMLVNQELGAMIQKKKKTEILLLNEQRIANLVIL